MPYLSSEAKAIASKVNNVSIYNGDNIKSEATLNFYGGLIITYQAYFMRNWK